MRNATEPPFFLEEGSQPLQQLQAKLTAGSFRCNLMMVQGAEHAAAMLRHECASDAVPDLLLVYGGLHDGRAAELLGLLKQDDRLSRVRFPVVVDSSDARQEAGRRSAARPLKLKEASLAQLEQALAQGGERFWWVMARFS